MDIALESESNGWDPPTSIPETTCLTWTTPVSGLRMGVLTVVWFIWGKGGHWGLIPGITLTHLTPQELLTIPTPSWRGVGVHENFTGDGQGLREILRHPGPRGGDSGWRAFTLIMTCPFHLMATEAPWSASRTSSRPTWPTLSCPPSSGLVFNFQ